MRRYPYFFGIAASAVLLSFSLARVTHAAIEITHIDSGTPTADDEIVIFKNTGNKPIDISKWSVQIKNTGSSTTYKKNFSTGMFVLPSETFTLAHKNGIHALQAQMTYTFAMSSGGGEIILAATTTSLTNFDDASVQARAHYTEPAEESVTAVPITSVVQSQQEAVPQIRGPTEWNVILNELLPRPKNGDEFIELCSTHHESIDASGLALRDASGNTYVLGTRGEQTRFGSYECRAWKRSTTSIALNDTDSELVQLIDQSDRIVDQIIYRGEIAYDTAYAKMNRAWNWTTTPTPSFPNRLTEIPLPPIARALIPPGPIEINTPFDVSAHDTTDPNNDLVSLHWNFGDGVTTTGVTSTHLFSDPGNYTVVLIATDARGATSTVQRAISVKNLPAQSLAHSVAAVVTAAPPPSVRTVSAAAITKKTAAPLAPLQNYTGIVTVPLGVLDGNRFAVNEKIVNIKGHDATLAQIRRGSVIEFQARTLIKDGDPQLNIDAKNKLRIIGSSAAPTPHTVRGYVSSIDTGQFELLAPSSSYRVITKTRLAGTKRIAVGDTLDITGVELAGSTLFPALVPLKAHDILLRNDTTRAGSKAPTVSNYLLLAACMGALVMLHIIIAHYGKNIRDTSNTRIWFEKIKKIARNILGGAQTGFTNQSRRIIALSARLLGYRNHVNRKG